MKLFNLKSLALALGVVMAGAAAANAAPITGTIGFAGGATPLGSTDWDFATGVTFVHPISVTAPVPTGTFAPITVGTAATFNNITTFAPLSLTNPLWTVTFGGLKYSFEMTSITVQNVDTNDDKLGLRGFGTLRIVNAADDSFAGFDATQGQWDFTGNETFGSFNFSSTTGAQPVPEPVSTVLLGLGLLGAGVAARRRR